MIKVNEFRVTPDNKLLMVDLAIDSRDYFSSRYIKSITILAYRPKLSSSDIDNPYVDDYTQAVGTPVLFETFTSSDNIREYTTQIDIQLLPYALYYIYIEEGGSYNIPEGEEMPCGLKGDTTIAVAYNNQIFYLQGLNYLKNLNGCTPDRYFRDFMMQKKAFELALALGHHQLAYNWWKQFFLKAKTNTTTISTCGCHA